MDSDSSKAFTFIDLFAGLGGFHLALKALGGECVFASEIDEELRTLYFENYGIECDGDITHVAPEQIPNHDVLCAGFPCQPFSKAGKQEGFSDDNSGNLFYEIIKILDIKKPKYLLLENVSNLRGHDNGNTFQTIINMLSKNYHVTYEILSPHEFGIPQHRNRIYIVGVRKELGNLDCFTFPKAEPLGEVSIHTIVDETITEYKALKKDTRRQIEAWDEFIIHTYKHAQQLPTFPIWSMEFGATYEYRKEEPYKQLDQSLRGKHGKFGCLVEGRFKKDLLDCLPKYAQVDSKFPRWKCRFIEQNRLFYQKHKVWIDPWLAKYGIKDMAASHQKFEWNCGQVEHTPTIKDKIIQFRPSGIRVKNTNYSPSLVVASTQIPIFPWIELPNKQGVCGRYMTAREGAKLQRMEELKRFPQTEAATFRALGNAVNVEVVKRIAENLLKE